MLSKNNFNEKLRQMNNQKAHFSIRKLTIGAASVLIGITFMGINGQRVNADEMTGNTQPETTQVSTDKSTDATTTQQNDSDSSAQKNTTQTVEVPQNSKQDNTGETSQSTTDKKDTQVQKAESSETKADTAQNQVQPAANQTQKSADQNVEKTQSPAAANTTQPETQNDSKYNVADWDGSLNDETHEYTLNKYNGSDKENIYIPNTEDFIKAGKITDIDKVFITKDLIQNITKNGATSIVIDDQGSEDKNKVYAKGDWSNAFAGSTKLKSVNLKNAKNVTDDILRIYTRAIKNSNATTADLSDINLSPNVTSLHGLFSNMPDLKNVNLSGLDISHITDMGGMFFNVTSLKSVNLSGLNLEKVKDLSTMFYGANNLENVDFSDTKFAPDANTNVMFAFADTKLQNVNINGAKNITREVLDAVIRAAKNSNATTLDLSGVSFSPSITSFNNLFSNMPKIESIDLTGWDTSHITDMSYMFFNDPKLKIIK